MLRMLSTTKRKIILNPITETILGRCGGSTTELARQLTLSSGAYYTVNQVTYWCRTKKVPPEHARAVADCFGLPIEDVVPELFKMHHTNNR